MQQLPVRDPTTGGVVHALVDDDTYVWASQYTWRLQVRMPGIGQHTYVTRTTQIGSGVEGRTRIGSYLHREILGLERGDPRQIDHINHDTMDNRRENLRITDRIGNMRNREGAQKNSRTGARGVTWSKARQRYYAMVWVNRQRIYLGSSKSMEEAMRMAEEGRRRYYEGDV
jgi:hypothetical protein